MAGRIKYFFLNKIQNRLLFFIPVLILFGINSSCRHKNTECTAIITVNDSTGAPISTAEVRLYCTTPKQGSKGLEYRETTDNSGKATFVIKLEGIFDIDVKKGNVSKLKLGVVKMAQRKTAEKTVKF